MKTQLRAAVGVEQTESRYVYVNIAFSALVVVVFAWLVWSELRGGPQQQFAAGVSVTLDCPSHAAERERFSVTVRVKNSGDREQRVERVFFSRGLIGLGLWNSVPQYTSQDYDEDGIVYAFDAATAPPGGALDLKFDGASSAPGQFEGLVQVWVSWATRSLEVPLRLFIGPRESPLRAGPNLR